MRYSFECQWKLMNVNDKNAATDTSKLSWYLDKSIGWNGDINTMYRTGIVLTKGIPS